MKYLTLSAFLGFASLLYQTYCVHVLFMFFPRSSSIVALVVSAYLLGLGISSFLAAKYARQDKQKHFKALCLMQLLMMCFVLLVYSHINSVQFFLDGIIHITGTDGLDYSLLIHSLMFLYSFLPAFCLGGGFPILNGLYIRSKKTATQDVSRVYFWDLLGSVLGCLVTGYILIPYLGVSYTVGLAFIINGLLLWLCLDKPKIVKSLLLVLVISAGSLYIIYSGHKNPSVKPFNIEKLGISEEEFNSYLRAKTIFQKDSAFGRITVSSVSNYDKELSTRLSLFVNLRTMCSLNFIDSQNQYAKSSESYLSTYAGDLLKRGAHILNIGMGCGITAKAAIDHPNIDKLDILEINPVIIQAYEEIFDDYLKLSDNPNVSVQNADGVSFLQSKDIRLKYNAILIDIEETDIVYSSPLYTKEYIQMAKNKLNHDGVFGIWSFMVNKDFAKILYNTVAAVFPYTKIIQEGGKSPAILVYGSSKPLEGIKNSSSITNHQNDLINTLNKPILQNYYDPTAIFFLPENYKAPFSIK